ncbi:MAG: peptide chain release factor N(5)-glutamine methyltransferase [Patescibacteria group bacterium]|jgi:release factor glutamine methyltransferase
MRIDKKTKFIIYFQRTKKLPPFELELILAHLLKKSREYVLTHPEIKLSPTQLKRLDAMLKRREKGESLAYILGHKEFYGFDFIVNKHTLVPRPETELIVDEVLELAKEKNIHGNKKFAIIDVGTGSGCIIISLAKMLMEKNKTADIQFFAADISKLALNIAKKNAKHNNVANKIKFYHGNLLEPIIKLKSNHNHLSQNQKIIITANLPYLTPKQIKTSPSIKHEPRLALEAGIDGLKYYRELFQQLRSMLTVNGIQARASVHVFCEIDPGQKISIQRLAKKILPSAQVQIKKDLRGHSRLAVIKLGDFTK